LNIQGQPVYFNLVVAKRSRELVATSGGGLMRYIVIAGGAALLLSIALALYLSGYVLKPMRRLSQAAWELAHGNLDSRVEVAGQDEISELSRYFNYMAERIQKSAQLQKDFVANVSHEIRTPLTSIEGFSQALLEDMVESEEDERRYLNIISEEAKRLKRVLDQLLALSRIDAGAWILHPAPLAVPEYLAELGEKVLPQAKEKGVELKVESAAGMPPIETDRDALEQVLRNLLDNALKFTPPGGEVTLNADPLPLGGARIQVRDNGQGIPEEDLEHIFDRFTRVERSRSQRYGGSGLGLAVCSELLRLLGGKISVWSQSGKGTVFTVELPPQPPDLPPASDMV
jgi:signal transduction histidine kinase